MENSRQVDLVRNNSRVLGQGEHIFREGEQPDTFCITCRFLFLYPTSELLTKQNSGSDQTLVDLNQSIILFATRQTARLI